MTTSSDQTNNDSSASSFAFFPPAQTPQPEDATMHHKNEDVDMWMASVFNSV